MPKKTSIYAFIVVIVSAGLLAGGYWMMWRRSAMNCQICQRHIQPRMRVLAEIGGKRRSVCCTHCAITEALQEKKPLRLLEVTDYATGRVIEPQSAWYVEGSRAEACEHKEFHLDETKHVQGAVFDRCAPATFAFARREDADAFVDQNGGVLRSFPEIMDEVRQK